VVVEDPVHNLIVFVPVLCPVHMDAVCARILLELLEVLVQMRQGMLLDGGCQLAQFLPFRNGVHLAIALTAQVPKPLVMHFFVLRGGNEALGSFRLIYPIIAVNACAARFRFARTHGA